MPKKKLTKEKLLIPKEGDWYALSVEEIESKFKTSQEVGVCASDVPNIRKLYGENIIKKKRDFTFLERVVRQFANPLSLILLVAFAGTLFLNEELDALVIAVALLINVIIGVFQEERASEAFEKLNQSQEKFATVIRDGRRKIIPTEELVVGDLVLLSQGAYVPADIRLVSVNELRINESALTGEWKEVEKKTEIIRKKQGVSDQRNMAWMGTLVVSGEGTGIVVAVGEKTELGRIAESLQEKTEIVTPIQKNIRELARFLSFVTFGVVVIIVLLGLFRGEPIAEMILIGIAVAVSVVPEGLPAAVTAVLAIGMESILRRRGLVRNLLAAETLGSTTVILTDKTGTLTEANMTVAELISYGSDDEKEKDDARLLKSAVLASDAFIEEDEEGEIVVRGRPMERAIIEAGLKAGIHEEKLRTSEKRVDFVPFTSLQRYAASLNTSEKDESGFTLHVTGAPELLLGEAQFIARGERDIPMAKEVREGFLTAIKEESALGKRILGVAHADLRDDRIKRGEEGGVDKSVFKKLVFDGILVFEDPIRKDVPQSIKEARLAGARVIMLTGDSPETALYIARGAGIIGKTDKQAITGTTLEKMSDEELVDALYNNSVFARILPNQKLRIANLLRERGEVVAMTGDGINDAPALRNADIGIAVGSGTEVAKEASDIILLDNSFSIIVAAIEEGRRIIDNLRKIISHLVSTSFGEVFVITGALVLAAPLPILPAQILWTNIIGEGLLNFAFAFEPANPGVMRRSPRTLGAKAVLTKHVKHLIFLVGAVTGMFTLALFWFLYVAGVPIEEIRTIMFAVVSLDAIFFTLSIKNFEQPLWKINPFSNAYLVVALLANTTLLIGTLALEPLRRFLQLTELTNMQVALLVGVAIFNLIVIEVAKRIIFRRHIVK